MRIEVRNLCKAFSGVAVVRDVSFAVAEGQLVALLGPSGGGKSTILRIVSGLEDPDSGEVWLGGSRVDRVPARERGVGFVFQHYALFPHMTVRENIGFGLRVRKHDPAAVAARAEEMIRLVGLHGLGERYPHELSGGQRQRVALARALCPAPKVLLLDEPFGAVDAKIRGELRAWLRKLHDEVGVTSVFVTHDQEEALEIADRVVIVHDGRVEQDGSPEEIWRAPANAFVAEFVGAGNRFAGQVRQGKIDLGFLSVPAPEGVAEGENLVLLCRPTEVFVDAGPALPDAPRIARIAFVGTTMKVEVEIPGRDAVVAEIPPSALRDKNLAVGMPVRLCLSAYQAFGRDSLATQPATSVTPVGAWFMDGAGI